MVMHSSVSAERRDQEGREVREESEGRSGDTASKFEARGSESGL